MGDVKGDLGDLTIRVSADKDAKTLTVTDRGIGMTADEVERYINQIAFSSAEEFMEKYKNQAISATSDWASTPLHGRRQSGDLHPLLQGGRQDGTLELRRIARIRNGGNDRATQPGNHDRTARFSQSLEYGEDSKVEELLRKYCRFLPVPIALRQGEG